MDISKGVNFAVGQNLFRTSNLIGSCWPEALLFQSWGLLFLEFPAHPHFGLLVKI